MLSIVPACLLPTNPDLGGVILFFALAAAAGAGAIWLSFGRNEWRLDKGSLVLQRRFGQNRKSRFQATSLELVQDNSSDGGPTYSLAAVAADAPARTINTHSAWIHRRTIYSQSDDPTEPRNLGLWLSQRCRMPFADLTTAEAKTKELEALKEQLASAGRFGRVAVRIIERIVPSPPR